MIEAIAIVNGLVEDEQAWRLAEQIYTIVYGHIDSKPHLTALGTEIHDWVMEGDFREGEQVRAAVLANEWIQYLGEEAR